MTSQSPPLVGREHEISVLGSAIAACADGTSTVIEVTGDPGLGKSRLLGELGELAAAAGLTVLSGRASEFERHRPFGPFATLAPRLGSVRKVASDQAAASGACASKADGQPRTRSSVGGPPTQRAYAACVAYPAILCEHDLVAADRGHGVLLCLDDLQWADENSVDLLHFLLRQPPATPLILAYSHRPRQASARVLASFQHVAAAYRTALISLAPLDPQSCRTLIGTRHTPARCEQLSAISGGNPLYLEVLSGLRADGATGFADLPDTLRAVLAREIAPLTAAELTVLRAAAVLGDPFDPMLLASVSGLDTESALAALDVLATADLVRGRPGQRGLLQFRHPLLREMVSEAAPPGWRLRADRRVRVSTAAGRSLGAAYSGQLKPLRTYAAVASRAIDGMADGELAAFLDELGQLGWAEVLAEQHHDAIRHMSRGVRIVRQTGQSHLAPSLAYLLLCQSYAQHATGDLTGGITSASSAEETARLLDRPDLIGYALTLRAASTALRVNPAAAVEATESGLRSIGRSGQRRLREVSTAVTASVRLDQGRPDECVELLLSISGSGRSVATHALSATWYCLGAQAEMARGNTAAARDWAKAATEAADTMPLAGQRGYAHLALASCVCDEDPEHAAELLSCAAECFRTGGLVPAECRTLLLLGRTSAAVGRPDQATAVIGRAKAIADAHGAAYLGALAVNAQRQIGARKPRAPRRDAQGAVLSEQERRISAMVARGLSNRDIANSLFVSVKTVEAHLTRIFRKLGVSSRSAMISALAQLPQEV